MGRVSMASAPSGIRGTTYRISEHRSANKTDCVVFNPVTGKFNAAQVEDGTQALKPYSVGAGNGTGSAPVLPHARPQRG